MSGSGRKPISSGLLEMGPSIDSEITWLLHRAAQRMNAVTGAEAEARGIQLRDYIILSALAVRQGLTQVELGRALGLDKTTLMSQLDQLERAELVVRRPDPRDRRARIPEITAAGSELRAAVAEACKRAEDSVLRPFGTEGVIALRRMLYDIIGDTEDAGSCL